MDGKEFRFIRKNKLLLTQVELGQRMECSRQKIAEIEAGAFVPSVYAAAIRYMEQMSVVQTLAASNVAA